jgi:hypothetical protein
MADRFELPTDPKIAGRVIEAERASAEMGRIGAWLGSRDNAVIYIAALVALISLIAAALLAAYDSPSSPLRGDMAKTFAAIALSALSYIFGSTSRRANRD